MNLSVEKQVHEFLCTGIINPSYEVGPIAKAAVESLCGYHFGHTIQCEADDVYRFALTILHEKYPPVMKHPKNGRWDKAPGHHQLKTLLIEKIRILENKNKDLNIADHVAIPLFSKPFVKFTYKGSDGLYVTNSYNWGFKNFMASLDFYITRKWPLPSPDQIPTSKPPSSNTKRG